MNTKEPKIVIFGAGAIGGSVGAWVAKGYENIWLFDKPDLTKAISESGITTYIAGKPTSGETVRVKTMNSLSDMADADVVMIGVKNYSLEDVAKLVKSVAGDRPVIVGMQNGIENQKILPVHFSKVVYCVIGYNAWIDEPGVIGCQKKGPLVLGTPDNSLQQEMKMIGDILNGGVETVVTTHFQDAAHSKLIINLTNSLTTLAGFKFKEISDWGLFQKLLTNLLYEGVVIAKASGFKECGIGGMPPWRKIRMGAQLPQFLTRSMFNNNTRKMVMSSMTQDIIQRGGHDSELESINGYFLSLAEKNGVDAPYNKAVYTLCRQEFPKVPFVPLDVRVIWEQVLKEKRG